MHTLAWSARLIAAIVLVGLSGLPVPAVAFETAGHTGILHAAFDNAGLMTPQTVQVLVAANADADWHQFTPAYHFDSAPNPVAICDRIADGLQRDIQMAVEALRPEGGKYEYVTNRPVALAQFGVVTHEIEDFYSHSNWVDLAFQSSQVYLGEAPLLDALDGCAPEMFPAQLQTGYFNLASGLDGCPSSGPPEGFSYCHEQLAKDHPDSGHGSDVVPGHGFTFYQVAAQLATRTTRAAWHALHDRLVATYGDWDDLDVECVFRKLGFPDVPGHERPCRVSLEVPDERPADPATTPVKPDPVKEQPPAQAVAPPAPTYHVYLLGRDGGIGFVIATDHDVATTASCSWAGGGLDCSKPAVLFKQLPGDFSSVAAAKADLRTSLVCHSGYWGPRADYGGKSYWLQNNVGPKDCKTYQ